MKLTNDSVIEFLRLPPRPYNALVRAGIATIGQLRRLGPDQISDLRGMSPRTVEEIGGALRSAGLPWTEVSVTKGRTFR